MNIVAITGATGFVGHQIYTSLADKGFNLRVISRTNSQLHPCVDPSRVEFIQTSDLFAEPMEKLMVFMKDVDTLIHAAWYTEPEDYLTSNINLHCLHGTLRLARAFLECGARRFVGLGTCFEYDLTHGVFASDSSIKPTCLYAACKASSYFIINQMLSMAGAEFLWCRLFYLYGERENSRRFVPYLRRQLADGKPAELSSGFQIRDYLDVKEAGRLIAEQAIGSKRGAINICSGNPVTVREFAEKIADEFGRRDLLRFGARPDKLVDPACVVGVRDA